MPMPEAVKYASEQFLDLLGALKERAYLQTHNQCYAMVRAVLLEVRICLTLDQALAFADALPVTARAIFVEGLRAEHAVQPFPELDILTERVAAALSPHHIPPATIVGDVLAVVKARASAPKADAALADAPEGLRTLWEAA